MNYISQGGGNKAPKQIILVDYSNFIYRAYFGSIRDLEVRPWMPFVRGIDMLRTCVSKIRVNRNIPTEFIFAGDCKRETLDRMKIDPDYKAGRKAPTNRNFYIFRTLMTRFVNHMGFRVIFQDGAEGDDVIATCVHHYVPECKCSKPCKKCDCGNIEIVIFSADNDLKALLKYQNVRLYRPPGIFTTRADFEQEYGFHPKLFPDYKALIGDKSDNIKGVSGWGEVTAKQHIIKGDWLELVKLEGKWDEYKKAKALVSLNYNVKDIDMRSFPINIAKSNEGLHRTLFDEYQRLEAEEDVILMEKRLEMELR